MNLKIVFSHPWLLLLFVPAIALVFLPHLKLSKKYRRTRNRIISLVLQTCIMILSISVLAGTTFAYSETNYENEVVILVDVSDSSNTEMIMNSKNKFVQDILNESGGAYRIGIVKFANGYVYAAEMGYDAKSLYRDYIASDNPDRSGTDIATALNFTKTLIKKPKTAKVVILSDGLETDGEALATVMSLVLEGTTVDTVNFPGSELGKEVQINSVKFPDYNIVLEKEFTLNLEMESSYVGEATITVIDNGVAADEDIKVVLQKDTAMYPIKHTFTTSGSHELRFIVTNSQDRLIQNNTLCSYYYLEVVDRLLIIQREEEAVLLKDMLDRSMVLSDNGKIDVTSFNEKDCPSTLEQLVRYDQVILMNISNADMPEGFVDILTQYVGDFGGGLLTVGGNKDISENDIPEYTNNTYDYNDMSGTEYSKLLPVEAVEKYTPPVSVMLVIDVSTSMNSGSPESLMSQARKSAIRSLKYLNDRDYVGVITFSGENQTKTVCELTPASRRLEVEQKIAGISTVGGTVYREGINLAINKLLPFPNTRKKHIIFISDGKPSDYPAKIEDKNSFLGLIKLGLDNGITMSAIDISASANDSAAQALRDMGEIIGMDNIHLESKANEIDLIIAEILATPEITSYMDNVHFVPQIEGSHKVTENITDLPMLHGYYGVAARPEAVVPLVGDYAPLYAQWTFGNGKVGSFMSDLDGNWSSDFLTSGDGEKFILNVIRELFPQRMLQYTEIKATIELNNYRPRIQVENTEGLPAGEYYEVNVVRLDDYFGETDAKQSKRMEAAGKLFKCEYSVFEPGVYFVDILRKDASGRIIDQINTHTIFSYSAEYNEFIHPIVGENFIAELAARGGGEVITDPGAVFEAVTEIPESYDPRIPFIIAAILLFLLDVAVRKFKFKWPWEIIRDRKERKRIAEIKARRAGLNKR